jgi:hypothetical protein
MKFHLVSNTNHETFLEDLTFASNAVPEGHFVQEIQFTTVYDPNAQNRQIWSALVCFGEVPTS